MWLMYCWKHFFFQKYFFSKIIFSNFDFSKKNSIVLFFHCFMGHTQKKNFFPNFCFFQKKMIFEKKNFSGPHPDTPYLRKFWKKNFFPNFCFFPKKNIFEKKNFLGHAQKNFFPNFYFFQKKIFVEKNVFSGSHPGRPYLFFNVFFRRVVTHVPNANSRSSPRFTVLFFWFWT